MIVGDFNLFRSALGPAKAKAILLVDADTVLSIPATRKRFQTISGRGFQIVETGRGMQDKQLGSRPPADIRWKGPGGEALKEFLRFLA
jgi:hypothetical protein